MVEICESPWKSVECRIAIMTSMNVYTDNVKKFNVYAKHILASFVID